MFVRELISNASDALEKRRIAELTGQVAEGPSEIRITTDEKNRKIIFEDTGIGMNRDDLRNCLGTIAHSGSKEFIENVNFNYLFLIFHRIRRTLMRLSESLE